MQILNNMFYPDVKKYISPSAFNTFHNNTSSFIANYFDNAEKVTSKAMEGGTTIHGLIEGGFIKVDMQFEHNEAELTQPFRDTGVNVFGKPDSYGMDNGVAKFVDYKSGRDHSWTRESLNDDLKMELTAWLVWKELGEPEKVEGYIYWIGTEWNAESKEVIASDDEYAIVKCVYTADRLTALEDVIETTINKVNEMYEKHGKEQPEINEDILKAYISLEQQIKSVEEKTIKPLKEKQEELKEQILAFLMFNGGANISKDYGTFYNQPSKKWKHPDTLTFTLENGETHNVEYALEVANALKSAQKKFELTADPIYERPSLRFRAKKSKK